MRQVLKLKILKLIIKKLIAMKKEKLNLKKQMILHQATKEKTELKKLLKLK
jgi:hypothetical protein